MPSMGGSATLISAPHLGDLLDVDMSARVDQCVPSYQQAAGKYEPLPGFLGDGDSGVTVDKLIAAGALGSLSAANYHSLLGCLVVRSQQGDWLGNGTTVTVQQQGTQDGSFPTVESFSIQRELDRTIPGGTVSPMASLVNNSQGNSAPLTELLLRVWDSDHGGGVRINVAGALAMFGVTPPTAQPAITGALSTVADAPAQAVLTSIIAALVGCGLASDGTT